MDSIDIPDHLQRCSDEELVLRMQAGQHDALTVFFHRFHRLVLAVAMNILRDASEAEDVTQEVFLSVYRSAAQFDPDRANAKVWVLQFAYCRSFSRRRRLVAKNFYLQEEIGEFEEHLITGMAWGSFSAPEAKRLVHEALESLTRKERRTMEMAYFDGFSLTEIAERTGESHAAIRHQYYRGLDRLRSLLAVPERKKALVAVRQETF